MVEHERTPVDAEKRVKVFARLREQNDRLIRTGEVGNLLRLDPPEHTRLRHALTAAFTVRRMEGLRQRIADIVSTRLDLMEAEGQPSDFVETVAVAVPSIAICELLGVPYEQHEAFERFSAASEDPSVSVEELLVEYRVFGDLIFRVVDDAKSRPNTGLVGQLIAGEELTEDEIAAVMRLLVAAGHHTVKNQLALSVFALLSDRSLWEALVADRTLVPNAIEELLRYLTIFKIGAFTRTASVNCEIGGITVRSGESVTVSLIAANRDPNRFPEPDSIDLHRERPTGHLAFGYGIHMCLGQHLARVELQVALDSLLARFPNLSLAVPAAEVVMTPDDLGQAGPIALPVNW
jgi:cytochrome P450